MKIWQTLKRHINYQRMILIFFIIASPSVLAYNFTGERVFTMTNDEHGNRIVELFHYDNYGLYPNWHTYSTGGKGTGSGLGNQGGVIVNRDADLLFAVNAGSNSISVFKIYAFGLKLIEVVPSKGRQPVSITQHNDLVYVLNAGSDTIAGFRLNAHNTLTFIKDSIRPLSGEGTAPAQISFSPFGDALVVTERATNSISVFNVDAYGIPGNATINSSVGATPFGFSFDRFGHLLVSEAEGGATDASTVSSYDIEANGTLTILDAASPTTETAACWLIPSRDGRFAFTTNTGSSSISAFSVDRDGLLTLTTEDGVAASTGATSRPIDMTLSSNGMYMYALSAADGSISVFSVMNNHQLDSIPGAHSLPTTVNGLASY